MNRFFFARLERLLVPFFLEAVRVFEEGESIDTILEVGLNRHQRKMICRYTASVGTRHAVSYKCRVRTVISGSQGRCGRTLQ